MGILRIILVTLLFTLVLLQQAEIQALQDANFELVGEVSSYDAFVTRHPELLDPRLALCSR